jgi:hypothetical protein
VKDVLIRNNIFNDVCLTSRFQFCEAIISIYPVIPTPNIKKPFHRNIRIENNIFSPFDYPVLYANAVEGLTFSNNTIQRSMRFKQWHPRKFMITLEACKRVVVVKNKIDSDVLGKSVKLISTGIADLKVGKKQGIVIEKK